MLVLNSSYRGPLTYTDDVVRQAESALERLRSALKPAVGGATAAPGAEGALATATAEARRRFEAAMDDDFNTAGALTHFEPCGPSSGPRCEAGDRALTGAVAAFSGGVPAWVEGQDEESQPAAPFVDLLLECAKCARPSSGRRRSGPGPSGRARGADRDGKGR
jgi:cysteinyl-tRNA synthetase